MTEEERQKRIETMLRDAEWTLWSYVHEHAPGVFRRAQSEPR